MFGTIESTHNKIIEKINLARESLESLRTLSESLRVVASSRAGKKYISSLEIIDNLHINLVIDSIDVLESNYNLSIVGILSNYYQDTENEEKNTKEYYMTITSENFLADIDDILSRCRFIIESFNKVLDLRLLARAETKDIEYKIDDIKKIIDRSQNIEINIVLEKRNCDICKCGSRMTVIPELSERHCPNPVCGRIKKIIGAVFRDDQFYPQEGQKTKHGGYDTSRHYRFWMERLQALETKTFDEKEMNNIDYVIGRDGYIRAELNCETIREILKDPIVNATHLNDHAPLLVKLFGGLPPPQLDFQENRMCSIRFNKAMKLYDIVNPEGGNKPYYPYFIYKIIESMFDEDHPKRRLLDYIHLQSRETVIKNDKYYEQMCALSDDEKMVYQPTDPASRL